MVFSIRQQMVMGPTPPGTGVIAEAFGSTEAKSTSPQRAPFSSLSIPTSITAAPSLTMSPVTNFALPIDEDVCPAGDLCKTGGPGMADGHRCIPVKEKLCNRKTDYLAPADHDGILAGNLATG